MKLEYNILCIDDELESLVTMKTKFRELNAEAGIQVNYHDVDAHAGSREIDRDRYLYRLQGDISEKFKGRTFEIILIDLHLKNGIEGHQLIDFIRQSHTIYRPVIFYSAGSPRTVDGALQQLNEAARSNGVLGRNILISHRDAVSDLLAGIAAEMHDEEHKINQVRGLLMDRVSELEAMVIRTVASPAIWDAVPSERRDALVNYARRDILGDRQRTATRNADAMRESTYEQLKEFFSSDNRMFDTSQKTRFLKKMLALIGMDDQAAVLQEFIVEGGLNSVRNNYAHQTAQALDGEHSKEKCIVIRGQARRHVSNIKTVMDRFE